MTTYTQLGTVVPKTASTTVSGHRVEAYDAEGIIEEMIGLAITDEDGRFEITLRSDDLEAVFGDRPVALYFVVVAGQGDVLADTRDKLTWRVGAPSATVRIPVGERIDTLESLAPLHVSGTVYDAETGPATRVRVTVYDFTATSNGQVLGQVDIEDVDDRGRFLVSFDYDLIAGAGKALPDIRVEVSDAQTGTLLASTDRCQASAWTVIHLVIGGTEYLGIPERAAVAAAVAPALAGAAIGGLTDEQVVKLACASRRSVEEVRALRDAANLQVSTGIPLDRVYGMLRMGSPGTRRAFLEVPATEQTAYVQSYAEQSPPDVVRIEALAGTDPCKLDNLRIVGMSETTPTLAVGWVDVQRFLRLRNALGWGLAALDVQLQAVAGSAEGTRGSWLDDALIRALADVVELHERTKRPLDEIASWWADIEIRGIPSGKVRSLYDRLFMSDALPENAAFALPLSGGTPLADHVDHILAAIGITAADYDLLADAAAAADRLKLFPALPASPAGDNITLENLSRLYRCASLARALGLRISELRAIQALSGLAPLAGDDSDKAASPHQTVLFANEIRRLREASMSAADVHYLTRHVIEPGSGISVFAEKVDATLASVHAATDKIVAENDPPATVGADDVRATLLHLLDVETDGVRPALEDVRKRIEEVIAIVEGRSTEPPYAQGAALDEALGSILDAATLQLVKDALIVPIYELSSCRHWFESHSIGHDDDIITGWTAQLGGSLSPAAGSAPRLVAAGPGGRPAVELVADDDALTMDINVPSASFTLCFVLDQRAAQSLVRSLAEVTDGSSELRIAADAGVPDGGTTVPTGSIGFFASAFGGGSGWVSADPAVVGEQTLVFVFDHVAGTCTIYRDGEALPTILTYANHVQLTNTLTLGGSNDASFRGLISLFGVFEGALGGTDLEDLHRYLALYRGSVENARYEAIHKPLLDHIRTRDATTAVVQTVAKALDLSPVVVDLLVTSALRAPSDSEKPLIADLLPLDTSAPSTYPAEARDAMQRLGKSGWLVRKLGIHERELLWVLDPPGGNPGWLDFAELPISAPAAAQGGSELSGARSCYAKITRLIDILAVRRQFQRSDGTLMTLWEAADAAPQDEFLSMMAKQADWPLEDLTAMANQWALTTPTHFRNGETLVRLVRAMTTLRRLGLSASDALSWLDPDEEGVPAGFATARAITRVARSKYDADAWPNIARPLRDEVRNAQRDALVAYVIGDRSPTNGNDALSTVEDIYEELLIDPEMSACQLTSRILIAISAVQLFIHRALLGLEEDFTLENDEEARRELARHWKWMSTYRVWEANRKVFLYPENYLDPAWRTNKSHLFTQLESELLQGFLTEERTERAFRNYLLGLDEIAKLDIHAFTVHTAHGEPGVSPRADVHVFGMSHAKTSGAWFHRTLVDGREWTPWQPMGVELSRHMVPYVFNDRIHVVSVMLDPVKSDAPKDTDDSLPSTLAPSFTLFQLSDGTWRQRGFTQLRASTVDLDPNGQPMSLAVYYGPEDHYNDGQTLGERVLAIGTHKDLTSDAPMSYPLNGCFGLPDEGGYINQYARVPADSSGPFFYGREEHAGGLSVFTGNPMASGAIAVSLFEDPASSYQIAVERVLAKFEEVDSSSSSPTVEARIRHFFLQDADRVFYLFRTTPEWEPQRDSPPKKTFIEKSSLTTSSSPMARNFDESTVMKSYTGAVLHTGVAYRAEPFFHPYVCEISRSLDRYGLDFFREGMSQLTLQDKNETVFKATYDPVQFRLDYRDAEEYFDFRFRGAYATYNWEVFFHVPFLLAEHLRKEGRHEEARKWYHAIFNPTEGSFAQAQNVSSFWRVKPFAENDDIASIQEQLAAASNLSGKEQVAKLQKALGTVDDDVSMAAQLEAWRDNPFDPHLIARMRPLAYQKATVMAYIQNLIEWGDKLFRQDSMESINEATQIYLMAQGLLGPRPVFIDDPVDTPAKTYEELQAVMGDESNNFFIQGESLIWGEDATLVESTNPPPGPVLIPYFCFPPNEKLLGYWDIVEDRLFKIRHCMNIEGRARQLPLFQPPIDPALLIEANIAGLDPASVLDQLAAPMPVYRFNVLLAKAVEFAQAVSGYGATLLSVYEKVDGEDLSLIRQGHERGILTLTKQTRLEQIKEAREGLAALERTREVTDERRRYYAAIPRISAKESESQRKAREAFTFDTIAQEYRLMASMMFAIPQTHAQAMASGVSIGGQHIGEVIKAVSDGLSIAGSFARFESQEAATDASYERRWNEWKLQERLAEKELAQIDRQLEAARTRITIAERDLETLEQQILHAEEIETFLKEKFTRLELYQWMRERLASVYLQAFNTAYELASAAQTAYRFERAEPTATFLKFGYWDDRRAGFLAGERLLADLRRMDAAYLENNRRD